MQHSWQVRANEYWGQMRKENHEYDIVFLCLTLKGMQEMTSCIGRGIFNQFMQEKNTVYLCIWMLSTKASMAAWHVVSKNQKRKALYK